MPYSNTSPSTSRLGFLRLFALGLALMAAPALAQTELEKVVVTAKPHSAVRGGYEVSGDFKVDARMPYVVFAAQPLVAGDILKVSTHYSSFKYESPPLVLVPTGTLAAYAGTRLDLPEYTEPIPVESHHHHGTYFHVTYAGGTRIRVQRLRAMTDRRDELQEAGPSGSQP